MLLLGAQELGSLASLKRRVKGLGFKVKGLGFRGLGFRGLGFSGLEFKVWGARGCCRRGLSHREM